MQRGQSRRLIATIVCAATVVAACGDDGDHGDGRDGQRAEPLASSPIPASATTAETAPVVTSAPAAETTPDADDAPAPEPRRVLVIGDSSAAGMRWTSGAAEALDGAEFTLDLESCRRLVEPSCTGREGYAPTTALEALEQHADDGHDTLVVATGYNDLDADFEAAFDHIVHAAALAGVETIVWATYREEVGYELPDGAASSYSAMNEVLRDRQASGDVPGLHLLDWWAYTADAPHWLEDDGVHFSTDGAFGMADMISRALAALDGRPCPMPWAPGEPVDDPCPDPNGLPAERGGPPPVAELYTVGEASGQGSEG